MRVIGVDVGGTFTDIMMVCSDSETPIVHKVPSTPHAEEEAVVRGIEEILRDHQVDPSSIDAIVHGTTIATNCLLQKAGARVVLLTTAGLEDVIEIGRQNRDEIYELTPKRPQPLVARSDRIGVDERVGPDGEVLNGLLEQEVSRVMKEVDDKRPQAVAVSLLFSFRNPSHERLLAAGLRREGGPYVAISSEVLPEFREFERTSTTVLEAYLGPVVTGYLTKLAESLESICPNAKVMLMQSNGGTLLCSHAPGHAVGLALSGLAGGAIGGWQVARDAGVERAITLDMGGTSCDISAISGAVVLRSDNEVAGLPLRIPSVDVKTIGAGGGSIAWIDSTGVLHVGPQSSGARPGPASYNTGGQKATITDANLVLGRLNPDFFLGGRIRLSVDRAREAVDRVAQRLDLSIEEAAAGIIRISTQNMVGAIREVTVERGLDPRSFVLVPFGGAGPTQAADIAESLGIGSIFVPPHPGITSAFGLVCAKLRVDLMRSVLVTSGSKNSKIVISTLRELTLEASSELESQGASQRDIEIRWLLDMRYRGQSHELTIEVPIGSKTLLSESRNIFGHSHEQQFGYKMPGLEIEWVTARVVGLAGQIPVTKPMVASTASRTEHTKRALILPEGSKLDALVIRRDELAPGDDVPGPAIVEQLDSTTYIAPGWVAAQHIDGTLRMRREDHD